MVMRDFEIFVMGGSNNSEIAGYVIDLSFKNTLSRGYNLYFRMVEL